MKLLLTSLALVSVAAGASAQQIGTRVALNALLTSSTSDDFEAFSIGNGDGVNMDTFVLDSTTVVNGQSAPLVQPGATYSDPSQIRLQWNGNNYFSMQTKTIMANGSAGALRIDYSGTVQAMGLDARAFQSFGYSGTMTVFNGVNQVGAISFGLATGGAESVFLGFQNAGGITHVIVHSPTRFWSPIIDDHTYGSMAPVPEPATLVLAGCTLAAAIRRRRQRAA